jgi:hypothetical protein
VVVSNLGNIILAKIAYVRADLVIVISGASFVRTFHLVTSVTFHKHYLALGTTAFARIRHRFMSLMHRVGLDEFLLTILLACLLSMFLIVAFRAVLFVTHMTMNPRVFFVYESNVSTSRTIPFVLLQGMQDIFPKDEFVCAPLQSW